MNKHLTTRDRILVDAKSRPGAPEIRPVRQSKALVKFGLQPETVYRPVAAGMRRGIVHFSV